VLTGVEFPRFAGCWIGIIDTDGVLRLSVVQFKKPKASEKHKGKTLCRNGFHKWAVVKKSPFDTRLGKLITQETCSRCGKTRNYTG